MVRVLHILPTLGSGGIEMMLYNHYKNMDIKKVKFDFIVHNENVGMLEKKFLELHSNVYHITPKRKNVFKNYLQIKKKINSKPPYDVIHVHQNFMSFLPLYLAKKAGIKTRIAHSHNFVPNESFIQKMLNKYYRKIILSSTTNFFACGNDAGKWLYGDIFTKQSKIKVIKNPIEVDRFTYDEILRKKYRNKLNIDSKLVIGHIGCFNYQKNHNFLIDIFKEINIKVNKSRLILIGVGELEQEITEKVKNLNLEKFVIFLGVRSDVPELLQAMDIFLLPSNFEGFPVVGIEAQASGLKCFISDNVTKDIKITDLVEFISLKESAEYWALEILKYRNGYGRKKMHEKMISEGFDIKQSAKWLEKFYIRKSLM